MKAKLRRQKNKMMFHELENCPCGAPKHNPNKIKRLNAQWAKTLAGFKIPKKVEFCDLPKTSTGKIQKFELRKKAKELI